MSFVLILALGTAFFFFYNSYRSEPVYEMIGEIVETRDNFVKVEGMIGRKNKIIEFEITSATAFNAAVLLITPEQIKTGGVFTPEIRKKSGGVSDLSVGRVVAIRSSENLVATNMAVATKVDYSNSNILESFGFGNSN